ncbi:hypothetical protein [Desulfoferrobacter suflitae]|uniref:hypothetical protein n=1 Tax=Desulfoferrobacter suflitae TaxID=2865782 RepID=UPI002164E90C|nr:hypothetical protein [Desulfoferrobacter suflitae]MCK8600184.1 hypothetical protein [Desulfoferrobacter suflitae]
MNENPTLHNQVMPGHSERPECFGDPESVCPMDENGFMQPQTACINCDALKSCLQSALSKQGIIGSRSKQSMAVAKMTGFLKRWSDQKLRSSGMAEK